MELILENWPGKTKQKTQLKRNERNFSLQLLFTLLLSISLYSHHGSYLH